MPIVPFPRPSGAHAASRMGSAAGFSLVEVLVVIAIVLVMAGLARPALASYLKNMKYKGATTGIKRMLQTARAKSLANPNVHCGVYFDLASTPQRAILFQDTFDPGDYAYDAGKDKALGAALALPEGMTLGVPTKYPSAIIFRGDGSAHLSGKALLRMGNGVDTLDVLASTGRIKVAR